MMSSSRARRAPHSRLSAVHIMIHSHISLFYHHVQSSSKATINTGHEVGFLSIVFNKIELTCSSFSGSYKPHTATIMADKAGGKQDLASSNPCWRADKTDKVSLGV